MASKVNFYSNSLNPSQPASVTTSSPHRSRELTNHQRWKISLSFDCEGGLPLFHLRDAHGIAYVVTEFIVENVDLALIEACHRASSDKQKELIHHYLQERLDRATSYEVHVEYHNDKLFLRFGHYGLSGGMKGGEENHTNSFLTKRSTTLVVSTVQLVGGFYFVTQGKDSTKFMGRVLISSGISSGLYSYQTDGEKKKCEWSEYIKQVIGSGGASLLAIACGMFTKGSSGLQALGVQALGAGVGAVVPTGVSQIAKYMDKYMDIETKKKEGKGSSPKDMDTSVGGKAFSGFVGGFMGSGVSFCIDRIASLGVDALMKYCGNHIGELSVVLKKALEGGVSSGVNKFSSDLCENYFKEKEDEKKDFETLFNEAIQSAKMGAIISALIACVEQAQKIREYNQITNQRKATEKTLDDAKKEEASSKRRLEDTQKLLDKSQQDLADQKAALKLQEKHLEEQKLQQKQAQEQAIKDQQAIDEAQEVIQTAEKELDAAQKELIKAQQQVNHHAQAVHEAKKSASAAEQKLNSATQTAQRVEQDYIRLVTGIDKDIQDHLKRGYKVKVNGRYTKDVEKIRNAFLQGGKIEWKKGQNRVFGERETIKTKPSPLLEERQKAQNHLKQTEIEINELRSSIDQQQTELKVAEDQLNGQRQTANQIEDKLLSAQQIARKQAEIKVAQNRLGSYETEARQTEQKINKLEKLIASGEQEVNQHITNLERDLDRLKDILNKETDLSNLLNASEKAFTNQREEDQFRSYLHGQPPSALHSDSGPSSCETSDCTLDELIPHIVLVHALNHAGAHEPLAMQMIEYETQQERLICYIKGVITREGVIGQHLHLQKREFNGPLEPRPHMHWSWNQLVQPNSGGSWEESQFAILEPLSVFENSTVYKPFGVAPYDTMTFGAHRLSKQSILLVPESIVDPIKTYLPAFRDQIVSFQGSLRSAVIHTLKDHYPDTWHICDETGNLIGEKEQGSSSGYHPSTCLRKGDGQVIILATNGGVKRADARTSREEEDIAGLRSMALKDYYHLNRFIGLHIHAGTIWVEDTPYFKALKTFKENNEEVKKSPFFAGNWKDSQKLSQLGVLNALDLYHSLLRFDAETGVIDVGDYYINEAMGADLVSLFYQMYPSKTFDLTPLDLKIIFVSERIYLINFLENIKHSLESKEVNQKEMATEFFKAYCTQLQQNIISMSQAKKEVECIANEKNDWDQTKIKPSCLVLAQAEWEKVKIPENDLTFDLGKKWPLDDAMSHYTDKILETLPVDFEELRQWYRDVSFYASLKKSSNQSASPPSENQRQEQYRLNVVTSIIQWVLQERIYRASKEDASYSVLANRLLKHIKWLLRYQLKPEDFTQKVGDCLFDNIIAQLPISTLTSQRLREQVVQFMEDHQEDYFERPDYDAHALSVGNGEMTLSFNSWEQYLSHMRKPQVWATELEIQATAFTLDCPIIVLTVEEKPKIYNPRGHHDPLFLLHVNGNHFTACIPFERSTPREIYDTIKNEDYY